MSLLSPQRASLVSRKPTRRCAWIEAVEPRLLLTTVPTGFSEAVIASGIGSTTAMDVLPDGRVLISSQDGHLRVVKNGSLLATSALTLTVDSQGERGLLGVVHDPNFTTNQFIYVYHTMPAAAGAAPFNEVSRFTMNGDVAVPSSEVDILQLNNLSSATNHNGGAMHFGNDGMLYISAGENANPANSQTLNNLLGKILRIDVSSTQSGDPINDLAKIIPADNPFVGVATGVNQAIYALGFRNPFTFGVNPSTGTIFINDVGQDTWEEIDPLVAGDNYGWNITEGFANPNPPSGIGPGTYHDPLLSYNHSGGPAGGGIAITGGTFYEPPAGATHPFPASYDAKYFYQDLGNDWIRLFDPANPGSLANPDTSSGFATGTANNPVDQRIAPDGGLYYLARGGGGELLEISYNASAKPTITKQPANKTVTQSAAATFTVTASGTGTLTYQWQRNNGPSGSFVDIGSATSTSYTLNNAQSSDSGAKFRVVVTNGNGSTTSNSATLTVTANHAPVPAISITAGLRNSKFDAGTKISFSLSATDTEDGTEPAGRFTYQVDYVTSLNSVSGGVVRPFVPATSGKTTGSFTPATIGPYTLTDVVYRVTCTVTDSGGLQTTITRDIAPNTVTLTLKTNPTGLLLNVDGQSKAAPTSFSSVVGFTRQLDAPATETTSAGNYKFASWSDGGAAQHSVITPKTNITYTATYTASLAAGVSIAAGGTGAGAFKPDEFFTGGKTATVTAAINTAGVANAAPQKVYQSERYGNFTYNVTGLTANKTYTIRLHFSENWWGVSGRKGAGQRLQDVTINGVKVLSRFDIFSAAGSAHRAVVKTFTAKADASGKITLHFQAATGSPDTNAKVDGIEIL